MCHLTTRDADSARCIASELYHLWLQRDSDANYCTKKFQFHDCWGVRIRRFGSTEVWGVLCRSTMIWILGRAASCCGSLMRSTRHRQINAIYRSIGRLDVDFLQAVKGVPYESSYRFDCCDARLNLTAASFEWFAIEIRRRDVTAKRKLHRASRELANKSPMHMHICSYAAVLILCYVTPAQHALNTRFYSSSNWNLINLKWWPSDSECIWLYPDLPPEASLIRNR